MLIKVSPINALNLEGKVNQCWMHAVELTEFSIQVSMYGEKAITWMLVCFIIDGRIDSRKSTYFVLNLVLKPTNMINFPSINTKINQDVQLLPT